MRPRRGGGCPARACQSLGVAQDRPLPRWTATMNASSMVSFATTCLGGSSGEPSATAAGTAPRMRPRRCPSCQNTSRAGFFGGGACPSVGSGGRNRRAASHAERARLNVTRAIRATTAIWPRTCPSGGTSPRRYGPAAAPTPRSARADHLGALTQAHRLKSVTPNERRRSKRIPHGKEPWCRLMDLWGAAAVPIHVWIEGSQPLLGRRQSRRRPVALRRVAGTAQGRLRIGRRGDRQ